MRAPRKQRVASILKFERANHATQPVLQSPSLSPPAIPFSNYPEEKNRRKKKQQINRNESRKTDANHGLTVAPDCVSWRAMPFPHSIVAIPQTNNESALPELTVFLEKRQRARYKWACSSRDGSPDEFTGKQYRISPSSFTPTRKRIVWGVSPVEAAKFACGSAGAPKASNSIEKETAVLKTPIAGVVF